MSTARITLGATEYEIHRFNIGELERITDMMAAGGAAKVGFNVIRISLERASPPVTDPNAIEATQDQIAAAVKTILELSGMKTEPQSGEAPPAGG